MRNLAKGILVGACLALATPATATGHHAQLAAAPSESGSDLRVEIGGASLSSGPTCVRDIYGSCYYPYGYFGSPFAGSAFMLGADYDIPMGRSLALTVGARMLTAGRYWVYADNVIIVEPTAMLTYRFVGLPAPIVPRLSAGLGVYAGGSGFGAALRLGAGASFFPASRLGLAMDLTVDVGGVAGVGFSSAQFGIGPEFRF